MGLVGGRSVSAPGVKGIGARARRKLIETQWQREAALQPTATCPRGGQGAARGRDDLPREWRRARSMSTDPAVALDQLSYRRRRARPERMPPLGFVELLVAANGNAPTSRSRHGGDLEAALASSAGTITCTPCSKIRAR